MILLWLLGCRGPDLPDPMDAALRGIADRDGVWVFRDDLVEVAPAGRLTGVQLSDGRTVRVPDVLPSEPVELPADGWLVLGGNLVDQPIEPVIPGDLPFGDGKAPWYAIGIDPATGVEKEGPKAKKSGKTFRIAESAAFTPGLYAVNGPDGLRIVRVL